AFVFLFSPLLGPKKEIQSGDESPHSKRPEADRGGPLSPSPRGGDWGGLLECGNSLPLSSSFFLLFLGRKKRSKSAMNRRTPKGLKRTEEGLFLPLPEAGIGAAFWSAAIHCRFRLPFFSSSWVEKRDPNRR